MPILFAYGTLVPGCEPACVADLVAQFRPLGRAKVRGTLLDLGSYPGLVLAPVREDGVAGHLFALPDPALWRRLDGYEGFNPQVPQGSFFRRVTVAAFPAGGGESIACEAYVYNRRHAEGRVIASGDWQLRLAATEAANAVEAFPAGSNESAPNP